MNRGIWIDGRISWPFVIIGVLVTISLLAIDLIWRVFVLSGEALLTIAVCAGFAIVLGVLGASKLIRKRS